LLPIKNDKKAFDEIFEGARLYASYLSNAANPIVFESVVMGALFHNYKRLSEANKEDDKIDQNVATNEAKVLTENKPQGKILFDNICKKCHGLESPCIKERERERTIIENDIGNKES
jgi:cytochrome c